MNIITQSTIADLPAVPITSIAEQLGYKNAMADIAEGKALDCTAPVNSFGNPDVQIPQYQAGIARAIAEAKAAARQAKVNARRQARRDFVNPYQVGHVLHSSWGYEQTNVEFYEVVAVRPTSIQLREIAGTLKTDGELAMSGSKTARPGEYVAEPKWVTIQICVYEGNVSHHVPSPLHGYLYPTKPGQSIGCSWYA